MDSALFFVTESSRKDTHEMQSTQRQDGEE